MLLAQRSGCLYMVIFQQINMEVYRFFFFVTFLYLILLISYGVGMQRNKENTIDIQRWMIVTIAIGFLEALFRAGDLFAWNATGFRESFFMYAGVLIGVLKRSISRCVVIMLCLGWGIVRDNLGPDMKKIVTFGIGYAFLSGVSDILFTIALTSPKLGETGGSQLLSIVEWIVVGVTGLNLICYCWILESLSNTMQYLKNNNQVIKNRLFEKLRMCLLFSALFAICWTAIGFVDMYVDDRLFGKEQEYLITTMWEINYLYILIYVALIFRPNKNAKFYAYVMELPSIPEGEEHDLDFVVGSDDEDDDDDDDDELYRFKKEFDPDDSDEEGIGFEMGTRQNGLVLT
uniref:GOST seven transmembrane domain-containing protein n=1 Tax=Corethron hystrix TaxID=216773 RepID=A0A6U5IKN5_9STRA|mmetsp:Transcript_34229/g.79041  ORF Transcript_34229/g.79041 Transcript_34229/m.79041 type:complete len:345 (+) Transcript_34229:1271-2305(+)